MRDKEIQEGEEVHGRKRYRDVKGSTLERACSTEFWEGKCVTKREVWDNKGSAGGKGSTGMWSETKTKQQSLAGK